MRATIIHGPGDIRVEDRDYPTVQLPTDAVVKVTASCVCGSDLWPYRGVKPTRRPTAIGHEFIGIVESIGAGITGSGGRRLGDRAVRGQLRRVPPVPATASPSPASTWPAGAARTTPGSGSTAARARRCAFRWRNPPWSRFPIARARCRAAEEPPDVVGRHGHRASCRDHRQSLPWPDSCCGRRRRRRALRCPGREAARGRADHCHVPPRRQAGNRPRVRRNGHRGGTRRRRRREGP